MQYDVQRQKDKTRPSHYRKSVTACSRHVLPTTTTNCTTKTKLKKVHKVVQQKTKNRNQDQHQKAEMTAD